jgi:hypothetical protein
MESHFAVSGERAGSFGRLVVRRVVLPVAMAMGATLQISMVAAAQEASSSTLQFEALNQNMWGPGGAVSLIWERTFGTSWNESASVGGIIGSQGEICFPNPFGPDPCTGFDTRTGAQVGGETDGFVGVDLHAAVSAGSVDVRYGGDAGISTSSSVVGAGETFTINSFFHVATPLSSLTTQSPTVEAWADFQFDVFARGTARACAIGFGCTSAGGTLINVDETIEIASVNRNSSGEVRLLGVNVPLETSLGGVDITAHIPDLETTGDLNGSGDLVSGGSQDLLELSMDVPRVVADFILPGLGYALSGDVGFLGYSIFSSAIGPTLGVAQNFLFDATPMVTLNFDRPVQRVVGGIAQAPTRALTVQLGQSVELLGTGTDLNITPFYFLQNAFRVITSAYARVDASINVLSLFADMPFGLDDLTLGPVFSDNWSSPTASFQIDNRQFAMQFQGVDGAGIHMTATPEPATVMLLLSGLLVVAVVARRRTSRVPR